jgi:hypothetical protein
MTPDFKKSDRGCSIITAIVIILIIALTVLICSSCAMNRLTEQQQIANIEAFCQSWTNYKLACYNDSIEWCEYYYEYSTDIDSSCWFEHPTEPTLDGFINYLSENPY